MASNISLTRYLVEHQRVSVVPGSRNEVERVIALHAASPSTSAATTTAAAS